MKIKMRFTKDEEKRDRILELIERSNGYCPASDVNSVNNVCPCLKMSKEGECICGLYEVEEMEEEDGD